MDDGNNQLIRIMDNSTTPQNKPGDKDHETGEAASAQPQPQPQADRSFLGGLRQGAEDARAAAEKAIPKVKSAAADAAYWTAYGVSFAAVFHWALAKGFTPESVKSGVRDGVKAGAEAAQRWMDKLRQRKEETAKGAPDQAGTSADSAPVGAA